MKANAKLYQVKIFSKTFQKLNGKSEETIAIILEFP